MREGMVHKTLLSVRRFEILRESEALAELDMTVRQEPHPTQATNQFVELDLKIFKEGAFASDSDQSANFLTAQSRLGEPCYTGFSASSCLTRLW
jgi:hypothetical protein